MLVVREKQLAVFQDHGLKKFEAALIRHSRQFFPQVCEGLCQNELEGLVRHCVDRAGSYGFATEREICKYINIALTFGLHFGENGAQPWATTILNRRLLPTEKMERLYAAALEHEAARSSG